MLDRRSFFRVRPSPAHRAGLTPFVPSAEAPWDEARARHLLRRVSLSALPGDVEALLALAPAQAVDAIVDAAVARPQLDRPAWLSLRRPTSDATASERAAFDEANRDAIAETYVGVYERSIGAGRTDRMDRLGEGLLERMTILWSNRYVTELGSHFFAPWLFDYRDTLRRHALGDVQAVVHEIGRTGAMLRYLNGNDNRRQAPNENYARELLEQFTMGITGPGGEANYSQQDVTELSRALTGWRARPWLQDDISFDPSRFDDGVKTIFGQEGAFGYDDVAPLIFEARSAAIAHHLATALYREFVSLDVDADVVQALAGVITDAEFVIAPVLRTLLKSAHFFEQTHIGGLVKSPLDLILGSAQAWGLTALDEDTARRVKYQSDVIDQDLFNPPDVKGWRGGRDWINTSTIIERAKRGRVEVSQAQDWIVADALARPTAFDARSLARDLYAATHVWPAADADLDDLAEVLLAGTPAYAWDPTTDGGKRRIRTYMQHIVSLPAYQLR